MNPSTAGASAINASTTDASSMNSSAAGASAMPISSDATSNSQVSYGPPSTTPPVIADSVGPSNPLPQYQQGATFDQQPPFSTDQLGGSASVSTPYDQASTGLIMDYGQEQTAYLSPVSEDDQSNLTLESDHPISVADEGSQVFPEGMMWMPYASPCHLFGKHLGAWECPSTAAPHNLSVDLSSCPCN